MFAANDDSMHDWEIFNAVSAKISELKKKEFRPLPAPDLMVAHGVENDFYGAANNPEMALTMDKIKAAPHGIDLGPLVPGGFADRLATASGKMV